MNEDFLKPLLLMHHSVVSNSHSTLVDMYPEGVTHQSPGLRALASYPGTRLY